MADPEQWTAAQQANTSTTNEQLAPTVAALKDGGYVVVWTDASWVGDPTFSGIKAQIFDAAGQKVGAEFAVNTHTTGAQEQPSVAVLKDGNIVVAWAGPGHPDDNFAFGISYQIFSPTGQPIGNEQIANTVIDPATDTNQSAPRVAALGGGGFVIVFENETAINDNEIVAQVFDAGGTKRGTAFQVNTTTVDDQTVPDVIAIGEDKFVVAWQDNSSSVDDTSPTAIRMRVYQNDGTAVTSETLVNEFTTDLQFQPTIAVAGDTFMIGFLDSSQGLDPASTYLSGTLYDEKASAVDQYLLNDTTIPTNPGRPKLVGLNNGTYLLLWSDNAGGADNIKGQIVSKLGQRIGDQFLVHSLPGGVDFLDILRATTLADGRVALTWQESSTGDDDPSFHGIRTQIIDPRGGQITGTDNGETIYGSKAGAAIVNDTINGKSGDDTIHALDGNDVIDGDQGADTMHGGIGNDTYFFDVAGDTAIEKTNEGIDTVKSLASLTLAANIEHGELLGSAALKATGNSLANTIVGNGAANVLDGRGGADILRGRGGNDTYVVDSRNDVVDETAGGGTDRVLSSVSFSLSSKATAKGAIENLKLAGTLPISGTGNALRNIIEGNAKGNILSGLKGKDTLSGHAGNDTLVGGLGKDTMWGGAGNDVFRFDSVADSRRGSLRDTIKDFDDRNNDRIDLRKVSPAVLEYVGTDAFDGPNQVRVIKSGVHVIVEVNRGGSLAADMQVLLERTSPGSMTKSDFIL